MSASQLILGTLDGLLLGIMKPMHAATTRQKVVAGLFIGVTAGLIVLGLIGRIAMRFYAVAISQPTSFSLPGTIRLLAAAALGGAGAGALFAVLRERIPVWPVPITGAVYGAVVFVILYPGIRPPGSGGTLLFLLLFSVFGAVLDIGWKLTSRTHEPSPGQS